MSLTQEIQEKIVSAMKAKDAEKLSVLRMLNSAIKNEAINKKVEELSDEDVLGVIKSEVKKRKDSIQSYAEGGREDLAEKEKEELAMLEEFLPEQLSMEQIESKVEEVLSSLPEEQKSNFGAVMGAVMKEVGSQADGTDVREAVQKKLS